MDFFDFLGFYFYFIFIPKGKKSLGRSPPQELEVGPCSGPYLIVTVNLQVC